MALWDKKVAHADGHERTCKMKLEVLLSCSLAWQEQTGEDMKQTGLKVIRREGMSERMV